MFLIYVCIIVMQKNALQNHNHKKTWFLVFAKLFECFTKPKTVVFYGCGFVKHSNNLVKTKNLCKLLIYVAR